MTFLLLLSALLSALTGVGSSARAPQAAVAVGTMVAASAETIAARQTARPPAALPALTSVADGQVAETRFVVTDVPLWATRRRE